MVRHNKLEPITIKPKMSKDETHKQIMNLRQARLNKYREG